ncbi:hypothetical protein PHYC_00404 [Phycisphaerales bacterium]|nr:hypothetical protein PHYC_00404 [Phycisphaerales bacterium]
MSSIFVRNAERLTVFAGLALAITLGVTAHQTTPAVAQNSSSAGAAPIRLATADILGVTDRLLQTDKYISAHRTHAETLNRTLALATDPMKIELENLSTQYRSLADSSPERTKIEEAFNEKKKQFDNETQRALMQDEIFKASQAGEVYRLVAEAADTMGTDLGYTHVVATRSGPIAIRSNNVSGVLQEMLARPVIKGIAADDLTERLMKRFGLEEPPKAAPVPEQPPATPPAPAPDSAPKGKK